MRLTIIHTGQGYVAVSKPAGISTEAFRDHDTVEARAWKHFQRPASPKLPFVGIVHRLDRPVSGVLLLARNKSTLRRLNQAFAERRVKKHYLALTQVPLSGANGYLEHYMGRDASGKRAVVLGATDAKSKLSKLKYRFLEESAAGYRYEIEPITGRYHQIRAQLAAAGAPIIGDVQYGSTVPYRPNQIKLHAYQLIFPDTDGEIRKLEVPAEW